MVTNVNKLCVLGNGKVRSACNIMHESTFTLMYRTTHLILTSGTILYLITWTGDFTFSTFSSSLELSFGSGSASVRDGGSG